MTNDKYSVEKSTSSNRWIIRHHGRYVADAHSHATAVWMANNFAGRAAVRAQMQNYYQAGAR